MEIEELFRDHNISFDDAPDSSLVYVCHACGSFYSESNAPSSDLVYDEKYKRIMEHYYCDCHGNVTKLDYSYNIMYLTPYQDWCKKHLEVIRNEVECKLDEVESVLLNYY